MHGTRREGLRRLFLPCIFFFFISPKLIDPLNMNVNNPGNIYMLKVNIRSTRRRCDLEALEERQWPRSVVFIVNFEHISYLLLVFLLLTLNK